MTDVRSWSCFGSSAPSARNVATQIETEAAASAMRFMTSSSDELRELGAIGEHTPDRILRRVDIARERGVLVLQEREHLHQQHFERLAQLGKRHRRALPRVIRAEPRDEVVHLVLERELGQHADRAGVLEPIFKRFEVERGGRNRARLGGRGRGERRPRRWSRLRRRLRRSALARLGRRRGDGGGRGGSGSDGRWRRRRVRRLGESSASGEQRQYGEAGDQAHHAWTLTFARGSQRIFPKSPCRPSPPLNRLAPATPSLISASRPLYHSWIRPSRTLRPWLLMAERRSARAQT